MTDDYLYTCEALLPSKAQEPSKEEPLARSTRGVISVVIDVAKRARKEAFRRSGFR